MSRDPNILDDYLATVARLEPEITPLDVGGAAASIAISLKRIADTLDYFKKIAEKYDQEDDK